MKTSSPVKPAGRLCLRPDTLLLTLLLAMLPLGQSAALDPVTSKIYGRNTAVQTEPKFGNAVAVNESWILVGEPENDDKGGNAGAVHVFNTATRAWVRKITPADGAAGDEFGTSVTLQGDVAIIGAQFADGDNFGFPVTNTGAAYAFNVRTGAQLNKFKNPLPTTGDQFGCSVAISGNLALVGSRNEGFFGVGGEVFVFDWQTGALVQSLVSPDFAPGDDFGTSVALSGRIALVGAPGAYGKTTGSGKAVLFDAITGTVLHQLIGGDSANGDQFGFSVALNGGLAMVGAYTFNVLNGKVYVFEVTTGDWVKTLAAPAGAVGFGNSVAFQGDLALIGAVFSTPWGASSGAAYLMSVSSEQELARLIAPDGEDNQGFGWAVALQGSTAVVTAINDDEKGDLTGAAYVFRPVAGPFPMAKVAALKDFAPDTLGANFLSFGSACLSSGGAVSFLGGLSGTGVTSTTTGGVWNTEPNQSLQLALRNGTDIGGGAKVSALFRPIMNQANYNIFEVNLTGANVTAGNNRAIFADDGMSVTSLLRLDEPLGFTKVSKFLQVTQSQQAGSAAAVALLFKPGIGGADATNDSAVVVLNPAGGVLGAAREKNPSPIGVPYGQMSRVAIQNGNPAFTCALQSDPFFNQGVFSFHPGGASFFHARKGSPAQGISGAIFSSFSGETISAAEEILFRATVSGIGVTTSNNEGLWSNATGSVQLVAREGSPVPGLPGVVWGGFINYWALDYFPSQGRVLFLARLRGQGVTTSNDLSLWLKRGSSTEEMLLREGDSLPDGGGARIGTIQRVAAASLGGLFTAHYAVLCTLAGARSSTNQALLVGDLTMPHLDLRRPFLRLRKGTLYQNPVGTPTTLRSLSLPSTSFDATGAGAKGLGQSINKEGELLLKATFTDNAVHLVNGIP